MSRLCPYLFCLLLLVPSAYAATSVVAGPGKSVPAGAGVRQGQWHTFTSIDGLLRGSIRSMAQDAQGYLWIASFSGLCRYDGRTFTTFTTKDGLPDDRIQSVFVDREGILWIGTYSGLVRYDGETFTTFTTDDGLASDHVGKTYEDRSGLLWIGYGYRNPGRYDGVSGLTCYDGQAFTHIAMGDDLAHNKVLAIYQDVDGIMWFGLATGDETSSDFETGTVARYDGKIFTSFKREDSPLGSAPVSGITQDLQGALWFATSGAGAIRYDGESFHQFIPEEDGRPLDYFRNVIVDEQGHLWFGTGALGIARYDGTSFKRFNAEDGLLGKHIHSAIAGRDGHLFFGTLSSGIMRYDGTFTTHFKNLADGTPLGFAFDLIESAKNGVLAGGGFGVARFDGQHFVGHIAPDKLTLVDGMLEDAQGDLWLAKRGGYLEHYDGRTLKKYGKILGVGVNRIYQGRNGQLFFGGRWSGGAFRYFDGERIHAVAGADIQVRAAYQDPDGLWWLSTSNGVYQYNGEEFVKLSEELDGKDIYYVLRDRRGHYWFGGDALYRYDGDKLQRLTKEHGLPFEPSFIIHILEDRDGRLWISEYGSGIIVYDGTVFQHLNQRNVLLSNSIQKLLEDKEGAIWIGTDVGITRYRPSRQPPAVHIEEVVADQAYGSVDSLSLPSTQEFIRFAFGASSFSTPADQMVYLYRLRGYEQEWQQTRSRHAEYRNLPSGDYTFELRAVDRDLNYSTTTSVQLEIHPPYRQLALFAGIGLALCVIVVISAVALQRHRAFLSAQQQLNLELEEELQTAQSLQMGLMPTAPPQISGLDLAGRCLTANHVGGDIFQYFQRDGVLSVCLADVTGHAMEAAIPVVMFHGILQSQMESELPLEKLFERLNRSLHRTLDKRTFICFAMAELQGSALRLVNAGCPPPYHFSTATGEITELQLDAYPLGVSISSVYTAVECQLEPGDYLVLSSDGIVETEGPGDEIFGFERMAAVLRSACGENLSAEEVIGKVFAQVESFSGGAALEDDHTLVILKAEPA